MKIRANTASQTVTVSIRLATCSLDEICITAHGFKGRAFVTVGADKTPDVNPTPISQVTVTLKPRSPMDEAALCSLGREFANELTASQAGSGRGEAMSGVPDNGKPSHGPCAIPPDRQRNGRLGFFRFRQVNGRYLLISDTGKWMFLSSEQFADLMRNEVTPEDPLHQEMTRRRLLLTASGIQQEIAAYQDRHDFFLTGPTLHIMIVTLRCNHECSYCHASRKPMSKKMYDMTPETAAKAIDLIFHTPAEDITIEFQGGEPLANFPVVRFIIEQAEERNLTAGKNLSFSLVTNLSLMDEEKLAYLLHHRVQICTSLDGNEAFHNAARRFRDGNAYQETVKWIMRVNEAFLRRGLDPSAHQIQALLTVTRPVLGNWKEIIDTYIRLGMRTIFLRPLNPFGFAKKSDHRIGYPPEAFLAFYFQALDYIIEKNKDGTDLAERFATIFLTKMLTPHDPNYLDIRSPCGAAIGQLAYNYDGKIFTCDEGRMVNQMGDAAFQIGHVKRSGYDRVMNHDTVKSVCRASCLDNVPTCADCAYKPFCGTCPVYNYTEQGTLLPEHPDNGKCKIHMAILDRLFTLLNGEDRATVQILKRWAQPTERRLFYQGI